MAKIVGQALLLPIQNQGPVNLARRTNRLRRGYRAPGGQPPVVIALLFTGQSFGDYAERVDHEMLLTFCRNHRCGGDLFQFARAGKAALQPNATVLSILQGSTGKTVELRLNSGEKRAANSNKLMTISSFFLI
jgi:hypothetical protein